MSDKPEYAKCETCPAYESNGNERGFCRLLPEPWIETGNISYCMEHPRNRHLMRVGETNGSFDPTKYVKRAAYDKLRNDFSDVLKCVADKEAELRACQDELANTRTDLKICEAGRQGALGVVAEQRAKISKYEGMLGVYARAAAVASELAGAVTGIDAGSMRPNYRVDRLALMLRFHLDEVDKRLADK